MARSSDPRLAEVLAGLEHLEPIDDRAAWSRQQFDRELERLEAPFDEEADSVHVTSSAFVVGIRGTILHLHRRLNIWVQPGGHIDPGESASAAAQRETVEETGLAVVHPPQGPMLVHLDCHPGPRGHTHLDLRYLLLSGDEDPKPPPGESQDVRWCAFDEARELAEPALVPALGLVETLWDTHGPQWRAIVEAMRPGRPER